MSPTGKNDRPRAAGFTLIEVLVALVILSTGIVLVLRAFESAAVALAESRDAVQAGYLAEQRLVETDAHLRDRPDALPAAGMGEGGHPHDAFRWEISFGGEVPPVPSMTAGAAAGKLERVTVSVWRKGTTRRYEAVSLVRLVPEEAAAAR